MAVIMKIAVFRDVILCSLVCVSISEESDASIVVEHE